MSTRRTMAASTLCRSFLSGPRVALTPAHRSPEAWFLTGPEVPGGVSLLSPRAVLLPRSVVVRAVPTGSPRVTVGEGALWYDDERVAVTRWFTPPRVVRGVLRHLALPPGRAAQRLVGWRDRLGAGEGLTPYGDDVVCGTMLGLLATDDEAADGLARDIQEMELDARTTAISAALLRCAAEGWCIPEVDRLLMSWSKREADESAVQALRAVGHSSGRGLLTGLASVIELPHRGLAA